MFEPPRVNEFTQGTVFSCAYAENYKTTPVFGLVITARCDAVQDKVPVFSYVPVVALWTWMLEDGAIIALERIKADLLNSAANLLKAASLSESLLESYPLSEIYDAHFRPHENSKSRKTHCDKFRDIISNACEADFLLESRGDVLRLCDFMKKMQQKVDALIKELTGNRLSGFYLLRGLDSYSDDDRDYVAILREVHHIPPAAARKITKGISREDWVATGLGTTACPIFRKDDDFAMPLGRMKSPWIEHLMQNFALLFSRIGVTDNDFKDVKKSLGKVGLGE
ncbi:hypothetical protein Y045_4624 [Burkholderia pseudomallei MSHR2451]|uniref:hypothetical protein n=1 Tax=Burkholderia pseudomallei TaxID=28450 RepID=UPI0005378616|nr:hypothetical protein [Burkholderia pseudomallei]KGW33888.1 hypothetical protein Y045_4624 [Burkholderia pseudomallei MSHR2451]CRY45830.1 Uncharacterised protein [Burkholderia pseudomallei]